MQGSKIEIGSVYAVNYNNELKRFVVKSVITTRKGKHPTDFSHLVSGHFIGENGAEETPVKFSPDSLLGPYTEHAELVAQKKVRDDAIEADKAKKKAAAERLLLIFYSRTGIEMPEKLDGYGSRAAIFGLIYNGEVTISEEGVQALLKYFES